MQLIITGQGLEVTDSLRTYVEEKCQRLAKHYQRLDKVHVIIDRLSNAAERYRAEITLHAPPKADCVASAEDNDLRLALDAVVDKVDRQLTRLKGKIVDKRHQKEA